MENYRLMLQRSNLHCYLTKPYVTSWSLFEVAACGTPIITNRSPATTGTISIPEENTINDIEDIYQPSGIERAIKILEMIRPKSLLDNTYTLDTEIKMATFTKSLLNEEVNIIQKEILISKYLNPGKQDLMTVMPVLSCQTDLESLQF